MKDEIKEINIKIPGQILDYVDTKEHLLDLFDYITNLQEENKEFKARWKDTNVIIKDDKTLVMNTNAYICLEDYKSRVEKAIEYLEKYDVFKEFTFPLMKRDEENQVKSSIDYQFKNDLKKNLLNILQGVSKDER